MKIMLHRSFLGCLAAVVCLVSLQARASIEFNNVKVTDVTPSGFSVIWSVSGADDSRIVIYDGAGQENEITSSFEVTYFPLYSARQGLLSDYEQQSYQAELKQLTRNKGLSRVRVNGLESGTQYFFKINSNSNTAMAAWPLTGAHEVRTERENSFVSEAVQLVVDVNDESSDGSIVYVSVEGTKYPVSSVVSDGVGSGKAAINLSNFFMVDGNNWNPGSFESPLVSVMSEGGGLESELFNGVELSGQFNVVTNVSIKLNDKSLPVPPVIEPIGDVVSYEGGQIEFLIRASDPNMTVPDLSVEGIPSGAEFEYEATGGMVGQGVFRWMPQVGQKGTYSVSFVASDGALEAEFVVSIRINSAEDTDGDDLRDEWEIEYFGDLNQTADGDSDQDGYSNLEELQKGWNPTEKTLIPGVPTIQSPIFNDEVSTLLPVLTIKNSIHSSDIDVQYIFEVYSDLSMNDQVYTVHADEEAGLTSTTIQGENQESVLVDNHIYYWRVRGESAVGGREWVVGQFFVNTLNDLPSKPIVRYPTNNSLVSEVKPVLSVANSSDLDGDDLRYFFRVYEYGANVELAPLYEINDLSPGSDGFTAWQVPVALVENAKYTWYVEVRDEHGATNRSEMSSFLVSAENDSPEVPRINFPNDDEVITTLPSFSWFGVVDPEGSEIQYELELNLDSAFDSASSQVFTIPQGSSDIIQWKVTGVLQDNTHYYWRLRSFDGALFSDWSQAEFFINTVNDAPNSPTVANPAHDSNIEVLQPLLIVNPAQDLDGDKINYQFELYRDEALTSLVVEKMVVGVQWQVDQLLADNSYFYWRARAVDEHGAFSIWTQINKFFVNNEGVNDPAEFNFVLPDKDVELIDGDVLIQWIDSDPDSNAVITLLYESSHGDQVVIAEGIMEDLDGEADQFLWHISELPVGDYSIKAIVTDKENRLSSTAIGMLTVLPAEGSIVTNLVAENELDEFGLSFVQVNVVLDRAPIQDAAVTVNLRVGDETEAVIERVEQDGLNKPTNYLYFTKDNWNKPASVFVRGVDDCEVDGDTVVDLIFEGVSSNDSGFDGLDPADLVLKNIDNEKLGQDLFVCTYNQISQTIAGGGAEVEETYQAQLKNIGGQRLSPAAQLTVLGEGMSIVGNDTITFPHVGSSATVDSIENFTVRYKAGDEFDSAKLKWVINSQPPKADISVKLVGRDGEWSDGKFKFAVIVANAGPSVSESVELVVTAPAEVSIDEVLGAECSVESEQINCLLGDMASEDLREIVIVVATDDKKTKFNFSASVMSAIDDENPDDNTHSDKFGGALTFWGMIGLLLIIGRRQSVKNNQNN